MNERFALNIFLSAEEIKSFKKYCIDKNLTMSGAIKKWVQKIAKKQEE